MTTPNQEPPFDQAVAEAFRQAGVAALQQHPELRAVAVTFDWHGQLNEAAVQHGLWLGRSGPVSQLDEIVGSLRQTLSMAQYQLVRLGAFRETLERLTLETAQKLEAPAVVAPDAP